MSRKITLVILVSLLFTVHLFAAETDEFEYQEVTAVDGVIFPTTIRNNDFFIESIRLTRLAQETFDYGDYDASASFAEEAIRYAQLSNEFIADQLIGEAGRRLNWANSNNIESLYPYDYSEGKKFYEASLTAQSEADWDKAIYSAAKEIEIFTLLEEGKSAYLPALYTVRTWSSVRDCLWNIAAYSWVYGDPHKWRILYNANRAKLPNPNNPDLLEPGMVLEIPSISGEDRGGMWVPSTTYTWR